MPTQAFPIVLPSKPTAQSAGLLPTEQIPQLEKTLWVWKEQCQRTPVKNLLQHRCLLLQIPAHLPAKCCWREICLPGCPALLSPGVHTAGVCVEPGKTEGMRSKPALAAPSEGRRGEALLDTSSNNQNRYYCSQRTEKQTFLLWAGTKTPGRLLIPPDKWGVGVEGGCASRFLLFKLPNTRSHWDMLQLQYSSHLSFLPPLSKAFLFHFFNIFLSPCPFIFINSPRAVESAN